MKRPGVKRRSARDSSAPSKRQPLVGMGVTFRWAKEVYAGTITRIEATSIWLKQDKPLMKRGTFGPAFLFVEGTGLQEFEAKLDRAGRYILDVEGHRRPVELGVRRYCSTPLPPTLMGKPGKDKPK